MPSLNVITIDGRRSNFQIKKKGTTIGRSNDNNLILSDEAVSRHHAQITKTKEGYLLADLGSVNHTMVNGEKIRSIVLRHSDRIKIGRSSLTFLTKKEEQVSPEDSLILTADNDYENENRQIIMGLSESSAVDSQALLVSVADMKTPKDTAIAGPPEKTQAELERRNKVLWLLFEISRQLNSITDFRELLKKIMDLIFKVIDADYGFLILTGHEKEDQLIPVVVKYKDDRQKDKRKLKVSRTIIHKVIHDRGAILTSNAMADSRFDRAKSVLTEKIRSVICAPLWRKDELSSLRSQPVESPSALSSGPKGL